MSLKNQIISADWIFTNVGNPIKKGGVEVDVEGQVVAVYTEEEIVGMVVNEKYSGFIVPGFVNAHCHLELSYAVARLERGKGINDFIGRVEELKKSFSEEQKMEALELAMEILEEEGIVAVGDICNTAITAQIKKDSSIFFRNFIEVYGLDPALAEEKIKQAEYLKSVFSKSSIVPHATYSVSEKLFQLLKASTHTSDRLSIHNQESEAENQYFKEGKGPMMQRFSQWKLPIPKFIPSGKSPVETISPVLKIFQNPILFVHNTFSSKRDLNFMLDHFQEPWFCLCPSSNQFIEGQYPDFSIFHEIWERVCLGTDSLASNDTLSILHEMKLISKTLPQISLDILIKWATLNGAIALGFEAILGSLANGKKPGILLIEDVDIENQRLTEWSMIRVLKYPGTK